MSRRVPLEGDRRHAVVTGKSTVPVLHAGHRTDPRQSGDHRPGVGRRPVTRHSHATQEGDHMKGKRTPSRREDGQILAIFAGALVLLILISGLVIDGGNVFVTRRDSQDSADIGSMAGTKRLADYYVKSQTFTSTNKCTPRSRPGWSRTTAPVLWVRSAHGRRVMSVPGPAPASRTSGPSRRRRWRPPARSAARRPSASRSTSRRRRGRTSWGHGPVDLDGQHHRDIDHGSAARRTMGQLLPIAMVAPPTMSEGSI